MAKTSVQFLGAAVLIGSVVAFASSAAHGSPKLDRPVTVSANQTDVRDVLRQIFNQEGASYVLSSEVSGPVTMSLIGVNWTSALQKVCHLTGLTYKVEDGVYEVSKIENQGPLVETTVNRSTPDPKPDPNGSATEYFAMGAQPGSAITVDGSDLYVVEGASIYKLDKNSLDVIQSGQLPTRQ